MERNLTIAVIDQNKVRATVIEEGLRDAGHEHVHTISELKGLARALENLSPDVVIIDLENPRRDELEHFFALSRSLKKPIAMFVDQSDGASIEAAIEAGVSTYIVDGLRKERVASILDMAISRFNAFSRLTKELEEARGALESQKIIDKAKRLLMKRRAIDEDEAYQLLRKNAMNSNSKIVDVAQNLLMSADLLGADSGKKGRGDV